LAATIISFSGVALSPPFGGCLLLGLPWEVLASAVALVSSFLSAGDASAVPDSLGGEPEGF